MKKQERIAMAGSPKSGLVGAFLVAVTAMLLLAAPAGADLRYPFDGQFVPTGGQFGLSGQGVGSNSVAVDDQNGRTYVASGTGTGGVDVFETSSGQQLTTIDGSATPAGSFGSGSSEERISIAADNSSGDLYIADSLHGVIDIFGSSGAYLCQITGAGSVTTSASECDATAPGTPQGGLSRPSGIAVDQRNGDVYVSALHPVANDGDDTTVIDKFSPSGEYLSQITGADTPIGLLGNSSEGSLIEGHPVLRVEALAVNGKTGDLLFVDPKLRAEQVVTVSATEGQFRLRLGSHVTANLPYNIAAQELNNALSTAGIMAQARSEGGGLGSSPYRIYTAPGPLEALACESGATPLGGGSGCTVTPVHDGHPMQIDRFDEAGKYQEAWTGANLPSGKFAEGEPGIAADDASGRVYFTQPRGVIGTSEAEPLGVTNVFDPHGKYLAQFAVHSANNQGASATALDQASGKVYILTRVAVKIFGPAIPLPDVRTETANEVGSTKATLRGTVNPSVAEPVAALSDCHFDYVKASEYFPLGHNPYSAGSTIPCEAPSAAEIGAGTTPVAVHAKLNGLKPGTTYHFRLQAANQNHLDNFGTDVTVVTAPAPSITGVGVEHVTETSAQLAGEVNPEGLATSYRFEYDTTPYAEGEAAHGTAAPLGGQAIGSGASPVSVSQTIEGLSPGTTYYFRLAATNADGTGESASHSFVYLTHNPASQTGCPNEALRTGPAAQLPDCRAYEMVTPPHKNASQIGVLAIAIQPDLAADGERLISATIQCFGGARSCTASRQYEGEPLSFERSEAGWKTTFLAPPASKIGANVTLLAGAEDGLALFGIPTEPKGEDDFYSNSVTGTLTDIGPTSSPSLGALGVGAYSTGEPTASAGLSHLLWRSQPVWPAFDPTTSGESLYEYAGVGNTQPLLVGVSGGQGSTSLISKCATGSNTLAPGDLSADGRTVFFIAEPCASGSGANAGTPVPVVGLYARVDGELPSAHTVVISEPSPSECGSGSEPAEEACREAPPAAGHFEGAAEDGSVALFTSTRQLLPEASEDSQGGDTAVGQGCQQTRGPNGCNLYLYDLNAPAGHNLIDISAGDISAAGPRVQQAAAISPDGSHVYFVARGVLSEAPNEYGKVARDGAENLYLYERDAAHPGGRVVFIATVPEADASGLYSRLSVDRNDVSPDGRYLLFTSSGNLTPGAFGRANQVYRYDAQSGQLIRISIGERGFGDDGNEAAADARIVVPADAATRIGPQRSDPSMARDGSRIFFTSPAALAPGALEDVQIGPAPSYAENVYEWEEEGVGGCSEASGCVSLISDGRDTSKFDNGDESSVQLIGTDTAGRNVFFATTDSLLGTDTDSGVDYYDARVDGGFSEPLVPTPCEGDACKGAGTRAGAQGSPATAGFNGPEEDAAHPQKATTKHRKHKRHKRHPKRTAKSNRGGRK